MSRPFYYLAAGKLVQRTLPDPEHLVIGSIRWGRAEELFTPAFWLAQFWMREEVTQHHRLGESFSEEVAACLLGGHGIPAEVGLAAFDRLRSSGLVAALCTDAATIADVLREPLIVRNRSVVYRFWAQRSRFLAAAFRRLHDDPPPMECPLALRDYLLTLPGIGPKTSSWIVRNWLGSDEVAILDIHIVRAGILMGLFSPSAVLPRDYLVMERLLLELARCMDIPAAELDALIWQKMRQCPDVVADALSSFQSNQLSPATRPSRQSKQVLLPLA